MEAVAATHLLLGLLLATGLVAGQVAERVGVPRVAGYVMAGVVFSPDLLGGPLGLAVGGSTEALTSVALAIIAYLIGGSITGPQLRRTGRVILAATFGEALGAAAMVWGAMQLVAPPPIDGIAPGALALAFAAIASTTAPAATLAVLHQYRARGPLSETLLGVVALDDAVGIALFALASVAVTQASLVAGLGEAAFELLGSVALGVVGGTGLSWLARHLHQRALRLPAIVAAILLTIGIAGALGLSPLLASIVLGFFARLRVGAAGDRLFAPVEHLEEFVFVIFFTVAGAHFDAQVLVQHAELVATYFVARVLGKLLGAGLGARAAGAPAAVSRWLGVALMPQAGVAVGLALTLAHHPVFEPASEVFLNVILGTTMLYELVGPLAVRFALDRAGELGERREKVATR